MQVPMLDLKKEYKYLKQEIDAAVSRCFEHQQWIFGPEVGQLEQAVAQYAGVQHCVGTSSGTDALVLSLRALALQKGKEYFGKEDEIITTAFSFSATGDAILRVGATPVFVDIDPKTYNIDPVKISEYLRSADGGRVVGIVPVHLYGQSCDMQAIMNLAQEHNLFVVEDTAQAFGGKWKDRRLGSIGTMGAFSFFPSKPLGGCGDGGMVTTNNSELAELVRQLIKHGGKNKYDVEHIGYNARLDTLQAAILLVKLKYVDEFNKKRNAVAELYNERLKNIAGIALPQCATDAYHVYHQYTISVDGGKRDNLCAALKEQGISTMVYYPVLLPKMKVFQGGKSKTADALVRAGQAAGRVLNLPIGPLQTEQKTEYVIDSIRNFYES